MADKNLPGTLSYQPEVSIRTAIQSITIPQYAHQNRTGFVL